MPGGFLITAVSDAVWMTALALAGVPLFAYFQHHPIPEIVQSNPDESLNERQERFQVRVLRLVTLFMGAAGTLLACNVSRLGTIFEISHKLINSFTGPLLGVFLLGMFTRRAGSLGTFVGAAAGTGVSLCLVHQINLGRISFLWPSTFGLLTTLILGHDEPFIERRL